MMKEWKILIGITGALLLAYTGLSAALAPPPQTAVSALAQAVERGGRAMYTARETDGRIAIYAGDTPVTQTDTAVGTLPKIDRLRLREGIDLYSEEELKQFIEDYCS